MAKEKRPTWFKMFKTLKPLIDNVPDAVVGKALKAAFEYFESGEIIKLEPLEQAVFSMIQSYIDESYKDFERTSARNRQNVLKRWKNEPSDVQE